MVDSVKKFLSSSSMTMQNLVSVSHTVCAHVLGLGPKTLGDAAGTPSLGNGVADPYKHVAPRTC